TKGNFDMFTRLLCVLASLCFIAANIALFYNSEQEQRVTYATFSPRLGHVTATGQGTAPNWAGYVVTNGPFRDVSGTWTVPEVKYVSYPNSPAKEDTSTWIGIGGNSDPSLIQIGTAQEAVPTGQSCLT